MGETWSRSQWNLTKAADPENVLFENLYEKEVNPTIYYSFIRDFNSRYEQLRVSVFSYENIIEVLNKQYDTLLNSGAYHRDMLSGN